MNKETKEEFQDIKNFIINNKVLFVLSNKKSLKEFKKMTFDEIYEEYDFFILKNFLNNKLNIDIDIVNKSIKNIIKYIGI